MSNTRRGSQAVRRRPAKRSGWPPAFWFGTGLLTGILLCLLVYIALPSAPAPLPEDPETTPEEPLQSSRLDFYRMLRDATLEVAPPPPVEDAGEDEIFALQAGSFRKSGDADGRRAELLLLGLDVYTQKQKVHGETWHRVLVGPIETRLALSRARDKLADAEIESITLKLVKSDETN